MEYMGDDNFYYCLFIKNSQTDLLNVNIIAVIMNKLSISFSILV